MEWDMERRVWKRVGRLWAGQIWVGNAGDLLGAGGADVRSRANGSETGVVEGVGDGI